MFNKASLSARRRSPLITTIFGRRSNAVRRQVVSLSLALLLGIILPTTGLISFPVSANNAAQTLPFSQDWTNTGLITANDNWSAVPGIEGFLGQDITTGTGVDPQTLLGTSSVAGDLDVNANQTAPNTFASGGVAEFHVTQQAAPASTNPTIALNGSGTADAPYVLLYLNTAGQSNINVTYNVRDLDCSVDNAVQPVALQFRIGSTGNFTNVPAGFVADATTGGSICTAVTPVNVVLPAAANNQPVLQVRMITTNAAGNDEWVGIDDISVTGSGVGTPTDPTGTGQASPSSVLPGQTSLLTVTVTPGANPASTGLAVTGNLTTIGGSPTQTFFDNATNGDVTANDNVFSYNATVSVGTTPGAKTLPFSITDAELRSGSGSINLTVQSPPPPSDHVVISQVYGGGGNTLATYQNDYVELYNPSPTTFNLSGWSVQYAAAAGSGWAAGTVPLAGPIAPGEYYLIKLGTNGAVGALLPPANVEGTVNMAAANGKIALVSNTSGLTGASDICPLEDPDLVDLVGYGGTANCREGLANAPAGNNTTAVLRNANGAADTNQNGDDFTAGTPNPRRTAIIQDAPPSVSATDTDSEAGESTPAPRDASVAVFFSENVEVTGNWYTINCVSTGAHTAVVAAGPRNWVITPDVNFQPGEQCTIQIFAANVNDSDTDDSAPNTDFMQADYSDTFTVAVAAPAPYTSSVHLTMGNPSGAVHDTNQPNNYLLEKPELSLSYNRARGGPNWVSWHLSDDWTGALTRVDTFRPDPELPADWNRVNQLDYSNSGFDRGHMTPSADRLANLPLNQATFLMDNIIPQAPINNQQTWNNMEQALRTFTPANELYIVSGGAGIGGSGNNGDASTIADGRITVPAFVWKVALIIPKGENDISRVTCGSRALAVIVPNTNAVNTDWTTYITTVDAVESLTGYDFFANLPDAVEHCVEAGTDGNNPPGTEGQSVVTDEDTPVAITLTAVSPNANPLVYTVVSGPTNGDLTGSGANRTYTPDPDYCGPDSFTFKVNDGVNDSNTSTVNITVNCVEDPPVIGGAGSTLVNESCPPFNSAIDPGERVTVNLQLTNTGSGSSTNLVATLLSSGGVLAPSGAQNYGAIAPGGTAGRDFSLTADPGLICGGTLTATLQLQDGATNLGVVTYNFTLGVNNDGNFVCTTPCGGVRLVVTSTLSRTSSTTVEANVTVTNTGTLPANAATLTLAKLGVTNGTPLPQALGNIAPGGSSSVVVTFSSSVGGSSILRLGGTYAGGSFSSTKPVNVPPPGGDQ